MTRAFDAVCSVAWAIQEEHLRLIMRIANRENELAPEAVQALLGKPQDNTETVTVRNGVATVPVAGPIFRYANLFTKISGATSIEVMARDFKAAFDNPNVNAIILSIDSPGGEVNGTGEFADLVYEHRGRGKEIVAYVSNLGASAAYWIASAADRIVASPTAQLGSIGVIAAFRKPSSKEKAETVEFVSSQSPKKRPNINSEEGRAQIQQVVDAIAEVFVSSVARNRSTSVERVLEEFGAGDVFVGKAAVDAGLADELGSYERVLASLSGVPLSKETIMPSVKDAWRSFVTALEGEEQHTEPTPQATTSATANVADARIDARTGRDEEIARLQAENQRLLMERFQAEAETFATKYISGKRAFPAEREHMIAAFIQASMDDRVLGSLEAGQSRVAMLTTLFDARPGHQLTTEQLVPALARVLEGTEKPISQDDDRMLSDAEVDKLLEKTVLGSSIKRMRNGQK